MADVVNRRLYFKGPVIRDVNKYARRSRRNLLGLLLSIRKLGKGLTWHLSKAFALLLLSRLFGALG